MKLFNYLITFISYMIKPEKRPSLRLCFRLRGKVGIEIGGPSSFFRMKGYFPVYFLANRVDGVNFSNETIWEGSLQEGRVYNYFQKKIGHLYISEGTDLAKITDKRYDFVLSCHNLEHISNPIKAVKEWHRVLKDNGMLVLVLPDKRFNFDNRRPYSEFQHLLNDYEKNMDETDATHFEEILRLHDISMDPGLPSHKELKDRLERNYQLRSAHHHVFNSETVSQLLTYCGFKISIQKEVSSFHLLTIAVK